ncbi:hypothetical protein HZA97_08485 [Candidatus Woesearchaeota archaeon]|nr:hypothetical protein [Candidatus Woesearchaeota archaeon]
MNIDFPGLKSAIETLLLDGSFETLEYFGRTYFVTSTSDNTMPAEWTVSSYYDGADVYFWEELPEKFRGLVVLHEILEADLRLYQGLLPSEAHNIAVIHDTLYAKQKLTKKECLKYRSWRKKQKVKK